MVGREGEEGGCLFVFLGRGVELSALFGHFDGGGCLMVGRRGGGVGGARELVRVTVGESFGEERRNGLSRYSYMVPCHHARKAVPEQANCNLNSE